MKVNAPEKLYYAPYGDIREDNPITDNDIEYIRADVFIEKVESFLNKKDDRDSYTIDYIRRHLKEVIKEVGL